MITIAKIPVDGDVEFLEGDHVETASREFGGQVSVWTGGAPFLPHRQYVGTCHDFAQNDPINVRAFLLYGRSPIRGTAFFARDDGLEIESAVRDLLMSPPREWVGVSSDVLEYVVTMANDDRPAT